MNYDGKTVLVTGANGFLGGHLVARLATCARSVRCITRTLPQWPPPRSYGNVSYDAVDLLDADSTNSFFDAVTPEVVFHLASASGGSVGLENVLPHLHNDIVASANCLVAAERAKVKRFIVPGSIEEPLPSEYELGPQSPYALAKMTCVAAGRMFHNLYGTPTVICRICMAYGPGQKARKVVPYIIRSLLAGQGPNLLAGNRLFDWIFIEDALDALMLAGLAPAIEGCTLEIGSGHLVSLNDIANRIRRLIPGSPAIPSSSSDGGRPGRAADLKKMSDQLGWRPRTDLDTGLKATVEFFSSYTHPDSPSA